MLLVVVRGGQLVEGEATVDPVKQRVGFEGLLDEAGRALFGLLRYLEDRDTADPDVPVHVIGPVEHRLRVGSAAERGDRSILRDIAPSPPEMRPDVAGKPDYLGLAMNEDGLLRLKPQNLLLNLPLATPS